MALIKKELQRKGIIKYKKASQSFNVNQDVTDEDLFDGLLAINSLQTEPAVQIKKVVTTELIKL